MAALLEIGNLQYNSLNTIHMFITCDFLFWLMKQKGKQESKQVSAT